MANLQRCRQSSLNHALPLASPAGWTRNNPAQMWFYRPISAIISLGTMVNRLAQTMLLETYMSDYSNFT